MKVLYFARFRQIIGRSSDEIAVPATVATVGDLLQHLVATDAGCAAAFANLETVKAAVDHAHVKLDHALAGAREVAFFPPVTGG
jgi:molybdopterin synthase sulfur carrier subunit